MLINSKANGEQYINYIRKIVDYGEWIYNERTGKKCLAMINHDMEYHLNFTEIAAGFYQITLPLDTTRKSAWKPAIAELLGYIRGLSNAAQFRALGAKTWDANANENLAWLNNPARKGTDDMGLVYGAVGRNWPKPNGETIDLLANIVKDLANGIDNRGEILTFYNPGVFHLGCLRPCMYSHHFSLLNEKLYLNSTQRSCDALLGGNFNMAQVAVFNAITGIATGNIPKSGFHKLVNNHIYEDQYDVLMKSGHLSREPFDDPKLLIDTTLAHTAGKTGLDLLEALTLENFELVNYQHHDPIVYPFSV